jgi:hypothetical protein
VSTRDDLSKRAPAMVAQLDQRLLNPIDADPARFVSDPRFTPGARAMAAATIWMSARYRQSLGQPAPAARVHEVLVRLYAVETDEMVLGWLRTYRDAPPVRLGRATKRTPGPDEP